MVAVLGVRERDGALDGGEGLEALEVDRGLSQAFRLFDLIPVEDFEREVGTSTRGLPEKISEQRRDGYETRRTTCTAKSSFHSGLSVFFLVCDLYTRWPLRWNTT